MTPVIFHVLSDVVTIAQNPENADYDNPRGDVYGFAAYVIAEAANGERRRMYVATSRWEREAHEPAEVLAAALNKRLESGKLPVAFDRWEDTFPAYGSEAYDEQDTIEWEQSLEN